MALYARVHEAMSGPADAPPAAAPLQRQHFAADLDRTVLAYAGPEYVVYAVFRHVSVCEFLRAGMVALRLQIRFPSQMWHRKTSGSFRFHAFRSVCHPVSLTRACCTSIKNIA